MILKKKVNKLVPKQKPEGKNYTDLRQVMDYTRDFSMFYSGVEYEVYLDGCYDMGVRNFLMSYEYLRGKGAGQLKKHPDMHLFIDSGVFTYLNDPKYQNYTVEQWEEQLREYLRWAESHKESIFGMAELDLQNLLGMETITRWRREYFEPFMLRTGIPVCFIYHHDGEHIWENMCERYPYVGLTTVADDGRSYDMDGFRKMLKIAEKYNSLIHGFGMTQTSVLPQLPFYTVDSTSWKSGFRYGQISVWTGQKMSSFKREDIETRAFPVIKSYRDIDLDLEQIAAYYEPEVLRANVYAYQKAEAFIIERLKPLTYWKKARVQKVDLDKLPSDFFPTPAWLNNNNPPKEEIEQYAKKMNINPEYEGVLNLIYDATTYLNWDNPKYKVQRDWLMSKDGIDTVKATHDQFVNRIVSSDEELVRDLIAFYSSCVSGESDKLLHLGTNFDRIVKERDEYLDEEEEELVDVPEEEIRRRLHSLLPAPSDAEGTPEIDELDEEIYEKVGIIPTFDDKGKFLKGQVAVRKPKQVYSKRYPKFACDTCFAAARCVEFKAGHVCAFNKLFNRFDTRNTTDIIEAMQGMVNHNLARMQRSMILETMSGVTDATVTSFINQNMQLLMTMQNLYDRSSAEVLRQSRVIRADGSREEYTQITNPQSGGILERLFSQKIEERTKEGHDPDAKMPIDVEGEISDEVDTLPDEEEGTPKMNPRYEVDEDDDD